MTDLPDWVTKGLGHVTFETIGPRYRLRGNDPNPDMARNDYIAVLCHDKPPGYVLSRASIEAEHGRGKRLCWEVVWLREEVATRRYEEKQAKRMSRFAHEEEAR